MGTLVLFGIYFAYFSVKHHISIGIQRNEGFLAQLEFYYIDLIYQQLNNKIRCTSHRCQRLHGIDYLPGVFVKGINLSIDLAANGKVFGGKLGGIVIVDRLLNLG